MVKSGNNYGKCGIGRGYHGHIYTLCSDMRRYMPFSKSMSKPKSMLFAEHGSNTQKPHTNGI